jgi:putative ABC transport system substrate-binding protein
MQSLAKSGWADSHNLLIDVRWTAANLDLVRKHAKELVALKPDVLVATSTLAIMFSPDTTTAAYYMPSLETAARSLGVTPVAAPVRSDADIETAITMLGREPGSSFILPPDGFTTAHRGLITSLAEQAHVPFVAAVATLAREGGLLSYGPDVVDIYSRAASYVDRILRGTKPAELPVQVPVKFEMIVNAKTAKALGLEVPPTLLARADEVIE